MKCFKSVFVIAFLLILISAEAQKKVKKKLTSIDFEYNGALFVIKKGTKINVGIGTADNGEFKYIWTEEATGVGTSHYKRIKYNGERERSNKDALVSGFWYNKSAKNYIVYISFNKWDRHYIMLSEAAACGEIVAVDGFALSTNEKSASNTQNTNAKTNSLSHILKLKNGSEIKCNVLEMKPSESIKIETFDGSIFVYKMSEVEAIVKQESTVETPIANDASKYRNGAVTGNFIEKENSRRVRKDSIHGFFNATELYYLVPLQTGEQLDFTTKYGGFGFSHFLGYQFNSYLVLGGTLGFNYFMGEFKPNQIPGQPAINTTYYYPFVAMSQKFILLGDKKISPEIALSEGLGYVFTNNINDLWFLEGSIGAVYKLSKKMKIRAGVGITYNSAHFSGRTHQAQYLKVHAGLSF